MKTRIMAGLAAVTAAVAVAGCGSKAAVVSHNLSQQADNFDVARTITFIDTQNGEALYVVKGLCSVGSADDGQTPPDNGGVLTTTCEISPHRYIKDFLGSSRELTWFATQDVGQSVSDTHYEFIVRPSTLIPGVHVQ